MTRKQRIKCHAVIHTASVAAGGVGAGLAQIPGSDNAVITPIQFAMTVSLGEIFDIKFTDSAAAAALTTLTGSTVGRGISQALIGWLPGMGNAVNCTTAAGITETLGWMLVKQFDGK